MQSSRVRLMLIALLGVFAFGAVAAAAAQAEEAPFWTRETVRLGAGETHYITGKLLKEGETGAVPSVLSAATGQTVTCTGGKLKEGVLLGSAAGNPGTNDEVVVFTGCTVVNNGSACSVEGGTVTTNNVKSELVENVESSKVGKKLLVEFFPNKGVQFATLKFTGTACTVKSTIVEGQVAAEVLTDPGELPVELPNAKTEAHSWLLKFPKTPVTEVWLIKGGTGEVHVLETLKSFSEPSTLTGTALVLLANKELKTEEVNWSPLP